MKKFFENKRLFGICCAILCAALLAALLLPAAGRAQRRPEEPELSPEEQWEQERLAAEKAWEE